MSAFLAGFAAAGGPTLVEKLAILVVTYLIGGAAHGAIARARS